MEGIPNFRELGGLPAADGAQVRPGVMYRSGHLADSTDADRERLQELGIKTVVDLRTDGDIDSDGHDVVPDGIRHVRVPIHDKAADGEEIRHHVFNADMDAVRAFFGDGKAKEMCKAGSAMMAHPGPRFDSFREAFEVITDPESWPVLWHCSAGKDRAGWTATAILLAVGTDQDTIVDHYLASNGRGLSGRTNWASPEVMELLDPLVKVLPEYVEAQFDAIETHWGEIDVLFAEGYGLGSERIDLLRTELLEAA